MLNFNYIKPITVASIDCLPLEYNLICLVFTESSYPLCIICLISSGLLWPSDINPTRLMWNILLKLLIILAILNPDTFGVTIIDSIHKLPIVTISYPGIVLIKFSKQNKF